MFYRTIDSFRDGSLSISSDQLSLFMYRNYTVDHDNLADGLLCSDLIKMVRQLLTLIRI
jgi:hypothetical protein